MNAIICIERIFRPDDIINKDGKLTDEEFSQIKRHPVYGNNILSRINESPYLSIGANYHHERYDGRGYPKGLKGEEIPEIARIIAVADAYDAMTSNLQVELNDAFAGWNVWKERNKQGIDCTVTIKKEKNRISMHTENLGVVLDSTTTILDDTEDVYIALTGDQSAITDIHIRNLS